MPTSRLGLTTPAGSDYTDAATAIAGNMQIIDDKFEAVVCTSSTRPASPFNGMLIWETDTKILRMWDGVSTWRYVLSSVKPFGKMAYAWSTGPSSAVKNAETGPFLPLTFNTVAGRRYALRYSTNIDCTDGNHDFGFNKIRIRYAVGGSVSISDTEIYFMWADHADNGTSLSLRHAGFATFTATANQQVTFGLFLLVGTGGTLNFNSQMFHNFLAEDIGAA